MSKEIPTIQAVDSSCAAELLTLRAKLYEDELIVAGADPQTARQHVEPWRREETLQGFTQTLEEWNEDPDHLLRTIECEGRLAGYFHGEIRPSSVIEGEEKYVGAIQLAPEVRRRGIGRRLMQEFEAFAPHPDDEQCPITLEVLAGNTDAIAFYMALGFRRTVHIATNVPHLRAFEMRKEVVAKEA
ncbi:MAG TPA: GNAT family N-acetyltransferase [Candidatus Saccharimonadales bacterium]|nr:GNAT family N-acetyltransferase [Candidatus Saccharimonadales bacterium]